VETWSDIKIEEFYLTGGHRSEPDDDHFPCFPALFLKNVKFCSNLMVKEACCNKTP